MRLNKIKSKRPPWMAFWLCILSVFLMSCSAKQNESQNAQNNSIPTLDELSHDPYSAKLYGAKTLAKAEDFKTRLLNGQTFQLSEEHGKIIVLNIWATWCPPCVEETADLVDIYEKYKEKGLLILGVSIDEQGKSVVVPFVGKYEVTYPITIDDGTIMEKYGPTMGIPTTYIIDRKGNLRYFATGAITKKELEPRVKKLLNE